MATWRDGSSVARSPSEVEAACAALLHASQHAPGGTDEVANIRAAIRLQRITAAQGLITETFRRGMIATSTAGVSGDLRGNAVYMFAGETFTSMVMDNAGAGVSNTLLKMAVFSVDNTLRASSADVKASFTSTGEKTVNAATPYVVPADGFYWVTWLGVGGTIPAIARMAGGPAAGLIGAGTLLPGVLQAGLSDIPATLIPTASNVAYWMGVL